jgi:outer membrane lipoprotein-sorting protein
VINANKGFGDFVAEVEIVRRLRLGIENRLSVKVKVLEGQDGLKKRMLTVDSPRPLKGTSALMIEHKDAPTEAWVYLPTLRHVRRLGSGNEANPFAGSDFALPDIEAFRSDKCSVNHLRDETLEDHACSVIELVTNDPESAQSKLVLWVDDGSRVHRVDVFNKEGGLQKTVALKGYREFAGGAGSAKLWRPQTIESTDHINGKSALVTFKNMAFGTGLTERDFDRKSLEMAR